MNVKNLKFPQLQKDYNFSIRDQNLPYYCLPNTAQPRLPAIPTFN